MLRESRKGADYTEKLALDEPPLGERNRLVASHDEMVEHLDLDQREGFLEVSGEQLVRLARLRGPRGVVVREDHRRRVRRQRRLHHLARIDAGLRECAPEQLVGLDRAVLRIEEYADEHLMLQAAQPQ